MSMHTIRIHRKTHTERNPCIAVVIYYTGDAAWSRVFRHRGIHPFCEAERPMTPEETERTDRAWRLHYVAYTSWEGLIEDEYLVTGDLDWCREIHSLCNLHTPLENILPAEAFLNNTAGETPEKEE